jgi:alkylation response protein AidB-like acyl-CoA dehydrogenase|tara:strand:- start:4724 stop:5794 length:1071 start_codon:yes stop_codon:yes gene_type:complete
VRFHPTEEQLAIQDALKGTLEDAMPRERLEKIVNDGGDFDRESWNALMALGLGGLALPESVGGAGLGLVDLAMGIEVLGQDGVVGPVLQHCLAGLALNLADDADAREAWLGKIASGETVATVAFGGNWLPDSWAVTVAGGKASGVIGFVPGAEAADLILVGTQGGGLALIEKGAGVVVEAVQSADRTRRLSAVTFDGAPASVLFEPGDARVARIFDAALVLASADALGGAQYCLDLSVAYAKEREQFGVAIGRFQALKHQLAQMALEVEPARALMWYAAYAWDSQQDDAARAAAMAKAHIADRYVSVARAAVAAHGGIGYTWEYSLNTWFRRSLFDRAYLGSPTVHRARAADLAGW